MVAMLSLLLAVAVRHVATLPTNPPVCVQYYKSACSQALGEWLPSFGFSSDFWDRATHVTRTDSFLYEAGAREGTFFSYGTAGPPKGHVVYDYAHHIAFYDQGCCSWHDVVAAYAAAPPKRVVDRDLTTLRTELGARLGMSPTEIERIYGKARPQPVPHHAGVSVLAYTTWPPRAVAIHTSSCGQFQNFYFEQRRLILIQLGNGC